MGGRRKGAVIVNLKIANKAPSLPVKVHLRANVFSGSPASADTDPEARRLQYALTEAARAQPKAVPILFQLHSDLVVNLSNTVAPLPIYNGDMPPDAEGTSELDARGGNRLAEQASGVTPASRSHAPQFPFAHPNVGLGYARCSFGNSPPSRLCWYPHCTRPRRWITCAT